MLKKTLKTLRKERGYTLESLAERIGTSKQTIHRYENGTITNIPPEKVEALAEALGVTPAMLMGWSDERAELLSRYQNLSPLGAKRLPILGKIACGMPIYAEEEYESFAAVNSELDADFCLRASGDSMIGARIYDGDIVFIRSQDSVDNGEIAVVIIGEEATLKRVYYYPEKQKLILSPENPKYGPLVFINEELDSIKIIGKAIAFQSAVH